MGTGKRVLQFIKRMFFLMFSALPKKKLERKGENVIITAKNKNESVSVP